MINAIKQRFMKDTEVMLGDKKAQIEKVTPNDFKKLFGVVDSLPSLIVSVSKAPKGQEMEYLLTAVDIGLDEILSVVSILTNIEKLYLVDEVGMDEIIEYLMRMIDHNNLEQLAKNMKRLLPMQKEESK
jgi:hypothetical protein